MRARLQEHGHMRGHEHVPVSGQLPRQVLRVREEALSLLPTAADEFQEDLLF